MRRSRWSMIVAALAVASCHGPDAATDAPTDAATVDAPWIELITPLAAGDASASAPGFIAANFGGSGGIERDGAMVRLLAGSPLTGITWPRGAFAAPIAPTPAGEAYEIEVEAARLAGTDFFCALTFPVGADCLTLVLGGWGGSTCGFSCLDGRDASSNPTTTYQRFEKGRFVTARVRVTADRVEAFLDGAPLCATPRAGVAFALRPEVEPCAPLGIASYATTARIRAARWRLIPRSRAD